jgi:hypothetical protein
MYSGSGWEWVTSLGNLLGPRHWAWDKECQAHHCSEEQLCSSGEAETAHGSWTNAGGQAVFVDADFSVLLLPG